MLVNKKGGEVFHAYLSLGNPELNSLPGFFIAGFFRISSVFNVQLESSGQ